MGKDILKEKALLVGWCESSSHRWKVLERLEELEQLTRTAGADVFEKIIQIRKKPDPKYFLGKGKIEEIKKIIEEYNINLVIFDRDLRPSQTRNLEEVLGIKVIDRTELIMDIFAQHARTAEAKIQVELAQLTYRLSKLVGKGKMLSRLGGGIGTRGPGETKLEVDRRRILKRISTLKRKLKEIEKIKKVQSKKRNLFYKITLVGYTNAGKSTLMNKLTKSHVKVEDALFSTLDTTTRLWYIDELPKKVVLSDTVGFIEDLPPQLVASFKATLSVVKDADLLLHVIDITHPNFQEKIYTVEKILDEIGVSQKSIIKVFNKIDILLQMDMIKWLKDKYENSVFISALTGENIEILKRKVVEILKNEKQTKF